MDDISIDRSEPATPGCILTFSPANGTTGTCLNQTLSWDIVALASGYKMTISTNSPDYNNVGDNIDLGVALTFSSLLNPSTTYGWKISPYNGFGEAAGCAINTFTTGTSACYCTPFYLDGSCGTEDFIDDFSTTAGLTNITPQLLELAECVCDVHIIMFPLQEMPVQLLMKEKRKIIILR
ncbi:MAG: hypothetical protein IPH42_14705 [Bacteroidetes bacterium]|nr:hypothetical protein [Bacteroidota bacterium]